MKRPRVRYPKPHDHYSGSSRCVECDGPCRLEGSARFATEMVRFFFEGEAIAGRTWVQPMMQTALDRAGVDIAEHQRRAAAAVKR